MVVCEKCGKELPEGVVICPYCKEWTTLPRMAAPKPKNLALFYQTSLTLVFLAIAATILIWIAINY